MGKLYHICHFPFGKCGLKYRRDEDGKTSRRSLPVWEVWIEIISYNPEPLMVASLPVWEVWIEIVISDGLPPQTTSLPVWEVWIEINPGWKQEYNCSVTSRLGSVD